MPQLLAGYYSNDTQMTTTFKAVHDLMYDQ